jgi:tRNA pseudouridine38-40 synthase
MRIALGIEYDGSAFNGWQTQPDRRGVQDALQRALLAFATLPVDTVCAGRTDAGVHALGQCVHFDAPVPRPIDSWVRGVNRYLPAEVAVRWARAVPEAFHARFSALERRYDYWILNDAVRSPLAHRRVGWVFRPLDLAAMAAAAASLVGTHDFSAFRAAECQARTPVRELRELRVDRFGALVRVRAVANAYLHHMVRNLVGTLVEIGVGRRPVTWAAQLLAARDRRLVGPTFSAAGLYLVHVQYDPALGFPGEREGFLPGGDTSAGTAPGAPFDEPGRG